MGDGRLNWMGDGAGSGLDLSPAGRETDRSSGEGPGCPSGPGARGCDSGITGRDGGAGRGAAAGSPSGAGGGAGGGVDGSAAGSAGAVTGAGGAAGSGDAAGASGGFSASLEATGSAPGTAAAAAIATAKAHDASGRSLNTTLVTIIFISPADHEWFSKSHSAVRS